MSVLKINKNVLTYRKSKNISMCSEVAIVQYLKLLQKQFLSGVPINKIAWQNIFENFTLENQQELINLTVNLDSVLKYPLKSSYQTAFLKLIIKNLEKQVSEVHDLVYSAFGRVVALDDLSVCFKHYRLDNQKTIILKESPTFISKGTTGLCSWQAAIALSEWCLAHKNTFQNKAVLELGSGVGLTGITLAANCSPKKLYLTDCHSDVLQALEDNVILNSPLFENSEVSPEVLNLPWEKVDKDFCQNIQVDLLIAADVVYDSFLFGAFINAVFCFFQDGKVGELIIACTERNKDTLGEFLALIGASALFQGLSPHAFENNLKLVIGERGLTSCNHK